MRKGGENLNGSGKEKGGNKEDSDQEEVEILEALGSRNDCGEVCDERRSAVALTVERVHLLLGGATPPSRYFNHIITHRTC